MLREKSCGAVVFIENGEIKYLLLQYGGGYWDFVKGQNEINESEKDAAIRELKEETGITQAKFVGDFRKKIHYSYRRRGQTIFKEVIYFLVQTQNSEVQLSYEHVDYLWLNYEEGINKLTFNNAKNILKKAHEFLKKKGEG